MQYENRNTPPGRLVVVSAPSGTGKTVVVDGLLEGADNMIRSVSATTREPRTGEIDGKDYFFITREQFDRMVKDGEFLEWAEVHGNMYGTPKKFIDEERTKGKDIFLVIDVQGAMQIRDSGYPAVLIFIKPPDWEELKRRLKKRGTESDEVLETRLQRAREEMEYANRYDWLIVNDEIDRTVNEIRTVLKKEKSHET